jgi:bifunctional non-homologous end joining protein LigD
LIPRGSVAGYRVQVHITNNEVRYSPARLSLDQPVQEDRLRCISAGSAIIDGEVVAPAADGTTDFSVLQNELKGRPTKIVMRFRPALS